MSQIQEFVEAAITIHQIPIVPPHFDPPGDGRAVRTAQQEGNVDLGESLCIILEQKIVIQSKGDIYRQLLHFRTDPVLVLLTRRCMEAEPGKRPGVIIVVGERVLQGGSHGVHVEARQRMAVPGLRRKRVQGRVDDADLLQMLVAELLVVLHHHTAAHRPAQQCHILQAQILNEFMNILGTAVHSEILKRF